MIRAATCVALVMTLALVDTRSAEACTCTYSSPPVLPAQNATGVPTNLAELLVVGQPSTYELRAASGAVVPLGVVRDDWDDAFGLHRVPVLARLKPATRYTLTSTPPDDPALSTQFTTGSGPDLTPPPALDIPDLTLAYATYTRGNSCGDLTEVRGTLELGDATSVVVRFTGAGRVQERTLIASKRVLRTLGTATCAVRVELVAGESYSVEIWLRDLAGNAGAAFVKTVRVRDCAPISDMGFDFPLSECPIRTSPPEKLPEPTASARECSAPHELLAILAIVLAFAVHRWRLRREPLV